MTIASAVSILIVIVIVLIILALLLWAVQGYFPGEPQVKQLICFALIVIAILVIIMFAMGGAGVLRIAGNAMNNEQLAASDPLVGVHSIDRRFSC